MPTGLTAPGWTKDITQEASAREEWQEEAQAIPLLYPDIIFRKEAGIFGVEQSLIQSRGLCLNNLNNFKMP